jgi:hypothetical protein
LLEQAQPSDRSQESSTPIWEPIHVRHLPRRARDTVGNTTLSLEDGVHILHDRTVITPATGLRGLMKPGGWNVRPSAQESGPGGAAKWIWFHLLLVALLGTTS